MLMASVMPVGLMTTNELTMQPTAASLPSVPPPPLPVLAGKIRIKSQIGDGSCSIVYKAYDTANQKMALKVYKPQCQWLAYSEAQLLHRYQHRFIVELFGLVENITPSGGTALAMELLEGGSLFRMISKQMTNPHSRVYSDNDALVWMLQVSLALEHLHQHTPVIAHRDIKTQNIMLTKAQGGVMVAKLLDFSLSTELSDSKLAAGPSFAPHSKHSQLISTEVWASQDLGSWGPGAQQPPSDSSSSFNSTSAESEPTSRAVLRSDGSGRPALHSIHSGTADEYAPSVAHGDSCAGEAMAPATWNEWWKPPGNGGTNGGRVDGSLQSHVMTAASSVASTFNLTGMTGSYAYMPPEVFRNEPYNEKADVFSFGVVMYELFARSLLIYTQARNGTEAELHAFAARVAEGARPPSCNRMPPAIWALVQHCWHQEAELRPSMQQVVVALEGMLLGGPQQQQQAVHGSNAAPETPSKAKRRLGGVGSKEPKDANCRVM